MTPRALPPTIAAIGIAVAVTACSTPPSTPVSAGPAAGANGDITVFAASSLASVFTTLARQFEGAHPGTNVRFSFAGSTALVAQLSAGAPADVFAAADEATMGAVVEAGLVTGTPSVFATNTLTIVTAPGNPQGINEFADLARPGISVVLCAPQVPCGAASVELEKVTGVSLTPISEESTVTDVLGKVTAGQADAGLVYVTDAEDAGDKVTAVAIPESGQAENSYPIALLGDSRNPTGAELFVEMVTGPTGRKALADAGFAVP